MNFKEFKKEYQHKPIEELPNKVSKKPLVSVFVQTYQHAFFIKECLDSILMQEVSFPFEILLGEDQSTDGTREICLEYAKKYPHKIRLLLHCRENNIKIGGEPTGRFIFLYNFYLARGKYIALCEGDDYWTDPLKLQKQVEFLNQHLDFVAHTHNAKRIGLGKGIMSTSESKVCTTNDIIEKGPFRTNSILFRNNQKLIELLTQSKPPFSGDRFLFIAVSLFGKVYYLNEVMCVYRINKGGVSQKTTYKKLKRDFYMIEHLSSYKDKIDFDKLIDHITHT